MKYYSYKLNWTDPKNGTHPYGTTNQNNTRLEGSSIVVGEEPDAVYYAYLINGELNLSDLSEWAVKEVTADELLSAAKTLNENSFFKDGVIVFPPGDAFNLVG